MSIAVDRANSEACAASHASLLASPDLPVSVTCWVYIEAQPGQGETHTVWWYGRDGLDSQFLKLTFQADGQSHVKFQATFQADNTAIATATGHATGVWHCISVVVEETTIPSEHRVRLYVDDAAMEEGTATASGAAVDEYDIFALGHTSGSTQADYASCRVEQVAAWQGVLAPGAQGTPSDNERMYAGRIPPRDEHATRRCLPPDVKRRHTMRATRIALGAGALAMAAPTQGQDVIALTWSETHVLGSACFEAGLDCFQTLVFHTFMDEFTSREWPLVAVEWYVDLDPAHKERLLPALAEHIDRGGRLLLVYTNLDEWPELQELVGVRTTGDITSVRLRTIWSVDPPHPTWSRSVSNPITADVKYWDDNGDFLEPAAGGYVLVNWDSPRGQPAITLTRNGRVLTCGLDYDAFDGDIDSLVRNQLTWLLACQADLDGDGELTFFDFLAFQNLFAAGDPMADFAFDGVLDFFDFIEFQEQFMLSCP